MNQSVDSLFTRFYFRYRKEISKAVIFTFSQSLGLFRPVVIWQAFFTFYTLGSLVEGQDVENRSRPKLEVAQNYASVP